MAFSSDRLIALCFGAALGAIASAARSVVSCKLAKQSPDAMRVKTPAAILGARGTELLVRVGAPAD